MKNDSFKKRLAEYTAITSALLAVHADDAEAQIQYTDVNPDLWIQESAYHLDLNNDGLPDFKLYNFHSESYSTNENGGSHFHLWNINSMLPFGQNKIITTDSPNHCIGFPYPITVGTEVSSQNSFTANGLLYSNSSNFIADGFGNSNSFIHEGGCVWGNDKIVGLELQSNGNTYYGWARLQVFDTRIVLKDYAINTVADSAIVAGDGAADCSSNTYYAVPSGDKVLCDDDVMNITLYHATGHPLQWMMNGDWLIGENDSAYTASDFGTYQVMVGDSLCPVIVSSVNLSAENFSLAMYQSGSICMEPNGTAHLVVYGNSSPYTYLWNTGATTQNLDSIPGGNYSVTVTGHACQLTKTGSIVVPNTGIPNHAQIYRANNILSTDSYNFIQWIRNGEKIAGATNRQYEVTETGTYSVAASNSSFCEGYSDTVYVLYIPAFNFFLDKNKMVFQFPDLTLEGCGIEIVNELGQITKTISVSGQTTEADLSFLPDGIYFCYIRSGEKILSGKFIIED